MIVWEKVFHSLPFSFVSPDSWLSLCVNHIITSIAIFRILWRIKVVKSSTQKLMNCKMIKCRIESWMTLFSIVLFVLCFPDCIPVLLCSLFTWWCSGYLPAHCHPDYIWGEVGVGHPPFSGKGFFEAEGRCFATLVTNLKHSQTIKTSLPNTTYHEIVIFLQ